MPNEHTERVTVRVAEHLQRLFGGIRAVKKELATKLDDSRVGRHELIERRDGQIEVQLLGNGRLGPRRAAQLLDFLEGQTRRSVASQQVQPVATGGIVEAGLGWLMSLAVHEIEKLPPKLGADTRIGRIDRGLGDLRSYRTFHVANSTAV